MGTWGTGSFDNDTAADWGFMLENSHDLSFVEETLDRAVHEEYLDSDTGSEAIAAIETVARLKGNWGKRSAFSEPVDEWVEKMKIPVSQDLIAKCVSIIDKILGESSELNELWSEDSEDNEYEDWKKEVLELKQRVIA